MKVRVEPCIDVINFASKVDDLLKEELKSHTIRDVSADYSYVPNRIQRAYHLENGHLVVFHIEEFV